MIPERQTEKAKIDVDSFNEDVRHGFNKRIDVPEDKDITDQLNALHLTDDCRRAYAAGARWMKQIFKKQIRL